MNKTLCNMEEVRYVQLHRNESVGFGFSILGGAGSEFPPIIYDVIAESPADKCGQLKAGDIILEVNAKDVEKCSTKEVLRCLRLSSDVVTLKIKKDLNILSKFESLIQHPDQVPSSDISVEIMNSSNGMQIIKNAQSNNAKMNNTKKLEDNMPKAKIPRFETYMMTGDLILNLTRSSTNTSNIGSEKNRQLSSNFLSEPNSVPTSPHEDEVHNLKRTRVTRSEDTIPAGCITDISDEYIKVTSNEFTMAPFGDRIVWTYNAPVTPNPSIVSSPASPSSLYAPPSSLSLNEHRESINNNNIEVLSGSDTTISSDLQDEIWESNVLPLAPSDMEVQNGVSCENNIEEENIIISTDDLDPDSLISQKYSPKGVDIPSAQRLARRLFYLDGFRPSDVSHHLSKNNDFSRAVAAEYVQHFDFKGFALDLSLRQFLTRFSLQGETQERERVLSHFSFHYLTCNPMLFSTQDAVHTLTCAILLLNTDLHGPNLARRMTCNEFMDNLAGLNEGGDYPRDLLKSIYNSIKSKPLQWAVDDNISTDQHEEDEDSLGSLHSPSDLSDSDVTLLELKRGYLMRKCCFQPGGRRTSWGRRGWRMVYCVLRDLTLTLYKNEKVSLPIQVLRLHHSLTTRATDYQKRPNVIRLKTADQAEYLFQASYTKEIQSWMDAINYAAAAFSAPPLPEAVGLQQHFQRPCLPTGRTKLELRDQLAFISERCQELCILLEEQQNQLTHVRNVKKSLDSKLNTKLSYLQHELERYQIYELLLHSHLPNTGLHLAGSPIQEVEEAESLNSVVSSTSVKLPSKSCMC